MARVRPIAQTASRRRDDGQVSTQSDDPNAPMATRDLRCLLEQLPIAVEGALSAGDTF